VIIDELDLASAAVRPPKHDSPLIVHTNTVKALPVSAKRLESVPWRGSKITKLMSSVDEIELPDRCWRNVRWDTAGTRGTSSMIEIGRDLVAERNDHGQRS